MSTCESDLPLFGTFEGEEALTVLRIIAVLISASVVSAWFSFERIKKLALFFSHWLA